MPALHIPIHYSHHVTNVEVRRLCSPLSETIRSIRLLRLFGYIARAESEIVHCRWLCVAINIHARYWELQRGCPAYTGIRTVEAALKPSEYGLCSAWHRAQDKNRRADLCRQLCSSTGFSPDDDGLTIQRVGGTRYASVVANEYTTITY